MSVAKDFKGGNMINIQFLTLTELKRNMRCIQ